MFDHSKNSFDVKLGFLGFKWYQIYCKYKQTTNLYHRVKEKFRIVFLISIMEMSDKMWYC
jgi:hypothetical protein